jgi:hypothetical protein
MKVDYLPSSAMSQEYDFSIRASDHEDHNGGADGGDCRIYQGTTHASIKKLFALDVA